MARIVCLSGGGSALHRHLGGDGQERTFMNDKTRRLKMEGEMPKDPMMLMSFINMKLRDFYPTLDALCDDMDMDRQELENKMAEAGLEYNAAANKFW